MMKMYRKQSCQALCQLKRNKNNISFFSPKSLLVGQFCKNKNISFGFWFEFVFTHFCKILKNVRFWSML